MCVLIVKPLIRDYWQVWCLIRMKICHGYQRKTHWNRKQRITAKLYITLVLNVNKTHKPNTNFYCSTWNFWRQLKFLLCFFFLIFTPFCINYYKCVFPCLRVYQGQCVGKLTGQKRGVDRSSHVELQSLENSTMKYDTNKASWEMSEVQCCACLWLAEWSKWF